MILIGACLLLLFSFLIWKEYAAYLSRGTKELREFIRFLECMREKMGCYLETPSEWIDGFTAEELERSGFLQRIKDGEDIFSAYTGCKESLCLCDDAVLILDDMFSHLGNGYLDTETAIIKASLDKLSKLEEVSKKDNENRTKAVGAVIGAVAIGIVILIL